MPGSANPPATTGSEPPIVWQQCEDIQVRDDAGMVIYDGPKWLRCTREECLKLVTHGQIAKGSCVCGNRRVRPALQLTTLEKAWLKLGLLPLTTWETALVNPQRWRF